MTQMMDVTGSLRKLARELVDIGVEVNEPFELVAKIGGVSFMLNWIADGLDRELRAAAERGNQLKAEAERGKTVQRQLPKYNKTCCCCGDYALSNGYCGMSGCINRPA